MFSLKENKKEIIEIILFTIILIFSGINISKLWELIKYIISIFMPFIIGIMIAFVLNVLLNVIEKKWFKKLNQKHFKKKKKIFFL